MAKTTVNNIVAKLKRMYDYNITDTDLDTLLIDCVNDSMKEIYQELIEAKNYIDAGDTITLTSVADQAYIDISSTLATADMLVALSERTNDRKVRIIDYFGDEGFIERYPDPTANTSGTADHAAIWEDRLYLGPTPTAAISYYAEILAIPADLSAGDTLPYKTKYDPVVHAKARRLFLQWKHSDSPNNAAVVSAIAEDKRITKLLIRDAASRIGTDKGSASRRAFPLIRPGVPES